MKRTTSPHSKNVRRRPWKYLGLRFDYVRIVFQDVIRFFLAMYSSKIFQPSTIILFCKLVIQQLYYMSFKKISLCLASMSGEKLMYILIEAYLQVFVYFSSQKCRVYSQYGSRFYRRQLLNKGAQCDFEERKMSQPLTLISNLQ